MRARPSSKDHAALLAASASSTTPLLLDLARRQAGRRRPSDLLAQYARDKFVEPSFLDQRLTVKLDALALEAAAGYEALLLSPVAPLGACSVVAPTSQDRTLTTTRGSEVVSDPTNVLALECAMRLREQPERDVRLCTVHQVLRAQSLPDKPGHTRHFRLFVLAEAGPARAADGFEIDAIASQLGIYDRLFDRMSAELSYAFPRRHAVILAGADAKTLAERAAERLSRDLPHVSLVHQPLMAAYYDGLRIMFGAETREGQWNPIADLGRFDWSRQLTANHRQRYIASGLGIQLVPVLFRGA
jgi:hypothetical protein